MFVCLHPPKQVIGFSQRVGIGHLHQLIVFLLDQLSSSFIIELHSPPPAEMLIVTSCSLHLCPSWHCILQLSRAEPHVANWGDLQRNEALHSSGEKKAQHLSQRPEGDRGQQCSLSMFLPLFLYYILPLYLASSTAQCIRFLSLF